MKSFDDINFTEDKDAPIVVIDSGLGGVHATNILSEKFPVENFVLLCDNEMLPIGNKEDVVINRRVNKICKKIKMLKPKAIVIACNSIDSISYETIRSFFPTVDVYSIIIPTITKALNTTRSKKVALLATQTTINNQAYMKYALMKQNLNLYGVECINLASAIEKSEDVEKTLNEETAVLNGVEYDTLILGCTHFSLIKDKIAKKFKNANIIDSTDELVSSVENNFKDFNKNRANKQKIYILGTKEDGQFEDNLKNNLKKDWELIYIKL